MSFNRWMLASLAREHVSVLNRARYVCHRDRLHLKKMLPINQAPSNRRLSADLLDKGNCRHAGVKCRIKSHDVPPHSTTSKRRIQRHRSSSKTRDHMRLGRPRNLIFRPSRRTGPDSLTNESTASTANIHAEIVAC